MQARESWFSLLREVAHDLNMPITAMMGFLQLIEQAGPLTDLQQKYLHKVESNLDNMQQLVSMLLDIAWLDANRVPDLSECDLGQVLHAAAELLEEVAAKRDITIEIDLPPELGVVMVEAHRVRQAVNNLLNNAIKYNRDGGTVWITAKAEPDRVQVSIRDSGLGIPVEDLPHLFDPFYRAKNSRSSNIEGTGLGLAIVKGVIEKHRGQIWVESASNEGSTFHFVLPRNLQDDEGQQHQTSEPRKLREQPEGGKHGLTSNGEEIDPIDDDLQESAQRQPDDVDKG